MKPITYTKDSEEIAALISRGKQNLEEVSSTVKEIIEDVKKRGDTALIEYTKKFDKFDLKPENIRVSESEISAAQERVDEKILEALKHSQKNVRRFHASQYGKLVKQWSIDVEEDVSVGERITPVESVGCYVPGGRASYPSTVLMTCTPAYVANVERIVLASPPPISDAVLAAAGLCKATEVYRAGGVQAIAALAYGTESIKKVSKIVGPGNKYVTAAKKQVFGQVDVDMPAGPSEIAVIADETADTKIVASDILAQAEHDPDATCVLVTLDKKISIKVESEMLKQAKEMKREELYSHPGIYTVEASNLEEMIEFVNAFAPEHVEVYTREPDEVAEDIINAGAVFIGEFSPVAMGDYASGANHVLPTSAAALFSSPLSVRDFVKYLSIQKAGERGLGNLRGAIEALSNEEGLTAHRLSVDKRFD